jgi:hypothetical protein
MKVTKFKIVSHFWLLARTQSTNQAIFFPKKKHCRNLATKNQKTLFKPQLSLNLARNKKKGCLRLTLHNYDNQGWQSSPRGLSQIGQRPITRILFLGMQLCSATRLKPMSKYGDMRTFCLQILW